MIHSPGPRSRCSRYKSQLNRDINETDSQTAKVNDDLSEKTESRNISFANTNYDQDVDIYNTIYKDMSQKQQLAGNFKLYNKRVQMFSDKKDKNKLDRMRNVNRSLRGSMKSNRSLNYLSCESSPQRRVNKNHNTNSCSRSRSTHKSKKIRVESLKLAMSQRKLFSNKTFYKPKKKVNIQIADKKRQSEQLPGSCAHAESSEYCGKSHFSKTKQTDTCSQTAFYENNERRKVFSRHDSKHALTQ